ncbi:IS3 family transposase [Wenyingzhuangia marina]|uniref:IS3 family transposase n=1 Tax=Wenyingzhuangia marina TaxID=1195760 RepID=UPI0034D97824
MEDEFYLHQTFDSLQKTKKASKNTIKSYNSKKLHLCLKYKTPNHVHQNVA